MSNVQVSQGQVLPFYSLLLHRPHFLFLFMSCEFLLKTSHLKKTATSSSLCRLVLCQGSPSLISWACSEHRESTSHGSLRSSQVFSEHESCLCLIQFLHIQQLLLNFFISQRISTQLLLQALHHYGMSPAVIFFSRYLQICSLFEASMSSEDFSPPEI